MGDDASFKKDSSRLLFLCFLMGDQSHARGCGWTLD
jgi:hypothetical protein